MSFFFLNHFELENIDFCARQVETTFIIKLFKSLLSSHKGFGSNASGLSMGLWGLPMVLRVAAMSMAQLDASGSIGMGAEPKDLKHLEYCCGIGRALVGPCCQGENIGCAFALEDSIGKKHSRESPRRLRCVGDWKSSCESIERFLIGCAFALEDSIGKKHSRESPRRLRCVGGWKSSCESTERFLLANCRKLNQAENKF